MKAPVCAWSNRSDRIEVYASGQNECSLLGSFSLTKSIVLDIYFNFATYRSVTSNASFISVLKLFSQVNMQLILPIQWPTAEYNKIDIFFILDEYAYDFLSCVNKHFGSQNNFCWKLLSTSLIRKST